MNLKKELLRITDFERTHLKLLMKADIAQTVDLKKLNLWHCLKQTRPLSDFLPAIQSTPVWPETNFYPFSILYNQLNLTAVEQMPNCEPKL